MKVSVLGYGTVGFGVCSMLEKAPGMELVSVLVRPGKADKPFKVSSIDAIVNDPQVEAVVEVMGGVEPAYSYVSAALAAGKHAVTSNKALVAAHGPELAKLAAEKGVAFLFSAACGGAVPFLHNLALAVESDRILSLGGILNGTTNFMLDSMQRSGMDYGDALKEAQALGYAEADPTADVSGLDALRKIMLACAVAYDKLPCEGFSLEGIESVTAADVAHFQSKGLVLRLVVHGGESEDGRLYAFVQPVLLPASSPEASVLKNFNMAKYRGENAGDIVLIGQGAGPELRARRGGQQRHLLPLLCAPPGRPGGCAALRRKRARRRALPRRDGEPRGHGHARARESAARERRGGLLRRSGGIRTC